jgi:hypothetical protein
MSSHSLIWFRLFDSKTGKQFEGTSATSILQSSLVVPTVDQFRKAVKAEYDQPNYLQNVPSSTLSVYRNEESFKRRRLAYMGNEEPLDPTEPLDLLGSKNDMLIDEKDEPLKPSFSIVGLGQNDEELALNSREIRGNTRCPTL